MKGLSPEQVKRGVESLSGDFAPSSVRFRSMCLTSAIAPAPGANAEAYKVIKRLGIEDKTKLEKQNAKNKTNLAKMREAMKSGGDIRI